MKRVQGNAMSASMQQKASARRTMLAFEAAKLRGWDRDEIISMLGISRALYYELDKQRREPKGRSAEEK